jgi:uncharacterized membrane protein YfcA
VIDLDAALLLSLVGVTFLLGLAIGFVGAGGAGLVVALLTSAYHLPVHTAIGTALATMCFVTISGATSHLREGNVAPRLGLTVGLSGAVAAAFAAGLSQGIPDHLLRVMAGLALWLLAAMVWLRSRIKVAATFEDGATVDRTRPPAEWARSIGLGASGGAAAAFFGIGMAPFLQLGFLSLLRLPLRLTVGTTMFALVFISASGALALARHGDVSLTFLIGTTIGLASGAYFGARFTRRAPRLLLRAAVVTIPIAAGALLIFPGA